MYLLENPVLQRELVSNLRMTRSFILLAAYVGLLGLLVYAAWPGEQKLDLARPEKAQELVNLFFFGQYLLVSLMTPSFAAGAITGEKERESFEMLMASPIKPGAIVLGKLAASLTHLAILMVCSLPIVMLCLPLGGVSLYEVFAAYFAMVSSVALFGMICLWCSSFFSRTSAALVVSYLIILPLVMVGVLLWQSLVQLGTTRLLIFTTLVPVACGSVAALLWYDITRRLLSAQDLGTEGKQTIDLETEAKEAVGLYINREDWPDRMFAPPKRTTFLEENANPIYDKEIRSEIFSQGTLMLRLVIQISMFLALFVMAVCLYLYPQHAAWYIAYVLMFNLLVGPVFSAGSITSERERQTLDLLLTTLITPWQMLWGKLFSGLRVSSVLTCFLLWPVVLACILPSDYWSNLPTMGGYLLIVALCAVTTAMVALFCSTLFRKSATALMASYLVLATLFLAPSAANVFTDTFLQDSDADKIAELTQITSPFAASFNLPLTVTTKDRSGKETVVSNADRIDVRIFWGYLGFSSLLNGGLLLAMTWLFNVRWRVSE